MHAITEGSAARIGDSRVRSTQMAEEDKWIVSSRNSASGLLVRPNLLLIIARGSSLGLINCPTSSTFMQLNVQGGALHSGGPSAAALLDPPQGRAWFPPSLYGRATESKLPLGARGGAIVGSEYPVMRLLMMRSLEHQRCGCQDRDLERIVRFGIWLRRNEERMKDEAEKRSSASA